MDNLIFLLEKVSSDTTPKQFRALDGDIAKALNLYPQDGRWIRMTPAEHGCPDGVNRPQEWFVRSKDLRKGEKWLSWYAPEYTSSIDAAVLLVPGDHAWRVSQAISNDPDKSFYFTASVNHSVNKDTACPAVGVNPAVALCIAALKARAELSVKESPDG